MLHLIPAPLHRLILRIGHPVRRHVLRIARMPTAGVAVVAFDESDRILLARHGYGSGVWSLPGGGKGRRESAEACARREMREELGCQFTEIDLAVRFEEVLFGAPHEAFVFTGRFDREPKADGREILELGWFARDDLPPDLSHFARYRLDRVFAED